VTDGQQRLDQTPDRDIKSFSPAFNVEEERLAEIQDQKERFLRTYSEFRAHLGKACKAADLQKFMVYRWRETDPAFRQLMDDVQESIVDDVEDALVDMALAPDTPAGAKIKAIEIHLKGNRPEKYSPKQESGRGDIVINFVLGAPQKKDEETTRVIDAQVVDGQQD